MADEPGVTTCPIALSSLRSSGRQSSAANDEASTPLCCSTSSESAANSSPLLEPPGFLLRNYGRGTPTATLLAHIAYGGRTYQLLAYAPQSQFFAYDQLLDRVVGSFGPVRDASVLNVQPDRVDIVRLERAMSVGEFAQQYRVSIPVAELALINEAASPESILAAGALVKRVM